MNGTEKFDIEDDSCSLTVSDSGRKKVKGFFITRLQLVVILFFLILILITVTLLAFYLGNGKQPYNGGKESNGRKDKNEAAETTSIPGTTVRPTDSHKPFAKIRLPKDIQPINYQILLALDLKDSMEDKLVNGYSNITVVVLKSTKYFVLHADNYRNLKGDVFKGTERISSTQFFVKPFQYVVLETEEEVAVGNYTLRFEFTYNLRDDLKGFYYSNYRDGAGNVKNVAATQFEPVAARFAFPCFDEPAIKATFDITIGHDESMMAISNMPVVKSVITKGSKYDTFQTSPIMPTYLVAFVVCDFGYKFTTADGVNTVNMTFYAPKDQINQIEYAMDVGKKILPYFEKFFNVTYPLPKADMIAIPDFPAGAMENWGLITYRARALLFDKTASSTSNKLYVASVISHELAHQWFGNIVTMDWWSDLWLNEGFASYVEFLGVDAIHPDWKVLDFQVITDMATGLSLDALVSSHPIYIEVEHPNEIDEIFDSISYQKGGCVLRMMANFLGQDVFVKGLMNYLRKYSYANAKTNNLWESLTRASFDAGQKYNVTEVMNSWILQMGFPVINVDKLSDNTFKLSQTRFLRDVKPDFSKSKFDSKYGYKWVVPFRYMTIDANNGFDVKIVEDEKLKWMNMDNVTVIVNSSNLILKGNAGLHGFFRVNYDADGWKNMINILNSHHTVLDVKDRAGILSDAFALANSGRLDYSTALDVFDYIDNDMNYLPWRAAVDSFSFIPSVLTRTRPAQKLLNKYLLAKITPLFDKYGFNDNENFLERYLQVLAVTFACAYGHKGCLNRATSMFKNWKENGTDVPSDFRSVVYYYGVADGGIEDWDWVFDRYRKNQIASEKLKLMYALSAIREPWALERYLNYGMNKNYVKTQDVSHVFDYVSNYGVNGRTIAWSFLKENWDVIYKRFSSSFFTMRRIFGSVTGGFTTSYELEQMKAFIKLKNPENGVRILEQSVEKIKANIQWLQNNEKAIENWLKQKA